MAMLSHAAIPTVAACTVVGVIAYRLGRLHAALEPLHEAPEATHEPPRAPESKRVLKANLLAHLRSRCYVRLQASAVHGVGVFAVIDMPPGVDPFVAPNAHLRGEELSIPIRADELHAACPEVVGDYVREFCAAMDEEDAVCEAEAEAAEAAATNAQDVAAAKLAAAALAAAEGAPVYYGINATGLVSMDTSWYLNHSDTPNIESIEADEEGQFGSYRSTRLIRAGEELLTDYRDGLESMYADIVRSASKG